MCIHTYIVLCVQACAVCSVCTHIHMYIYVYVVCMYVHEYGVQCHIFTHRTYLVCCYIQILNELEFQSVHSCVQ